jgi:hypothetical protein
MSPDHVKLLQKRTNDFEVFYKSLLPALVEFVGLLGISPAHEVLKNAAQFSHLVERATQNMASESEEDRSWLITRMAYFIGEVFVQRLGGCWYINDIPDTKYFARYVVGKFGDGIKCSAMIDPFEIATAYVDGPSPRNLNELLSSVEVALRRI